jgi:uncharacterized membrane protein
MPCQRAVTVSTSRQVRRDRDVEMSRKTALMLGLLIVLVLVGVLARWFGLRGRLPTH